MAQVTREVAARPVYRGAIMVGLLAVVAFLCVGVLVVSGVSQTLDNGVLAAHYPTDVLAGWAAGLVWLDVTLVSVGYLHQRRSEHPQPTADAHAAAP